ncbi:cupredoxin domain-containing protein [Amycolatopsis pigmentata]|uniref:Cupredoxin family copper-binding protein n=1 Tax=Amycolatopsis pigmentata TaxID=450801 RepID=A0ABW5FQB4_9PSEU
MRNLVGVQRLLVVIVLGAGLAACTANQPAPQAPAPSAMSMPVMPAPASSGPVATNSVSIKDFAFGPSEATVRVGATVTWKNADQDPHTVTSTGNAGPLRSPTLAQGETYSYTFTRPGRYDYLCTIHPFMTATVTVTP